MVILWWKGIAVKTIILLKGEKVCWVEMNTWMSVMMCWDGCTYGCKEGEMELLSLRRDWDWDWERGCFVGRKLSKDDFEVDILICMCWEVNYFFIWRVGLFKNEIWEGKSTKYIGSNRCLIEKEKGRECNAMHLEWMW